MVSLKKIFVFLILSFVTGYLAKSQTSSGDNHKARSVYNIMKKVADWQWNTLEQDGWKTSKKDWTSGSMYSGMIAMANIANDESYYKKLIGVGEDNNWQVGNHREEADDYCVGQLYAQLYDVYKNPRYIADWKKLADSLVLLPHTESLEWKNKVDYREWAWCDALFMGPPAFSYLTKATGDLKYLNKSSKLWWKTTDYLMDKEDFLFYRDSRFFSRKEKNGAKVFWSRGNGWVMGGLVKVLSAMDRNHPDSARFAELLKSMSSKIASLQQPDGTWHASLLDPASYPSKETSGTGFYCYAIAWGINKGILPYKQYAPTVYKAWDAMVSSVHADGKLGFVQAQGASPDKVSYDDTDVYGVGAFLLAGKELIYMDAYTNHVPGVIEVVNDDAIPKKIVKTISLPIPKLHIQKANNRLFVEDICTSEKLPVAVGFDHKKRPVSMSFTALVKPGTNRLFKISK